MKQEFIVLRESRSQETCDGNLRFPLPEIALENLDETQVAAVQKENEFIALAPNMPIRIQESVPDQRDHFDSVTNAYCAWGIESIGAVNSSLSGKGMIAAILDSGIDSAHAAFSGMDLVERDFVGVGNGDGHGHGTHCAGALFGQDVAGVRIGVARDVDRGLIAKVVDDSGCGESWRVFQALEWAARGGANVVLMSLSISLPDYIARLKSEGATADAAAGVALEAYHSLISLYKKYVAFLRLRSRAMIVVTGVGDATIESPDLPWQLSSEPISAVGGITSVGALDRGKDGYVVAGFSNSNPDVVAPGVEVLSAKAGSQGMMTNSGTSAAASYVAGVALLWGEYLATRRAFTSFDLEAYVTTSGDLLDIAPGTPKIDLGKGLIESPGVDKKKRVIRSHTSKRRASTFYKAKRMSLSALLALQSGPKVQRHRQIKTLRRLARARK